MPTMIILFVVVMSEGMNQVAFLGKFSGDYSVERESADARELSVNRQPNPLFRTNIAFLYTRYNGSQLPIQFNNGVTKKCRYILLDKSRSYSKEHGAMAIMPRN